MNEEEFIFYDSKHLSSKITKIKEKYFPLTKFFQIRINYFKKISKERTSVELIINRKYFQLIFEFGHLSTDSKKKYRKRFSSNLIDKIFKKFVSITDFEFYSDNLNFCSPNTIKYIGKLLNIKSLHLNNFIFNINNTDYEFLTKFKDMHLEDIVLLFVFDKFDSNLLIKILECIVSDISSKITLTFLFKYIDLESFREGLKISKNQMFLLDIKLNLIKYYPDKSVLITENDKVKFSSISKFIMEKYWPGSLEINFSEIIRAHVKMEIKYFFRKLNIKYKKDLFFTVNLLKDIIFSKKIKSSSKNKISSILTLCSKFTFDSEMLFKLTSKSFGLKFPNIETINLLKWHFYFLQEYDSHNVRKISINQIRSKMYDKPSTDHNNDSFSEIYTFKNNDLNTVSRILTQIEGFSKIQNKKGEKLIIGGRMRTIENNSEKIIILNCILTFNPGYSVLNLRTFKDNILIPHFNSSSKIFGDKNIIICGGLTISTFREEFLKNPIFLLDMNNNIITKIIPPGSIIGGFIFNHRIKVINENKIQLFGGYILSNSDDSCNFNKETKIQSKLSKNISFFEFDFSKCCWNMTVWDLRI